MSETATAEEMPKKRPRKYLFHPTPGQRMEANNDPYGSSAWNLAHIKAANEQVQTPIRNIVGGIRSSIGGLLRGIKNLGVNLITNPIALAANTVQYAFDTTVGLTTRGGIILSDTVSKTIGSISRMAGKFNERIHKTWQGGEGPHNTNGAHSGDDHKSLLKLKQAMKSSGFHGKQHAHAH